MPHDVTLLCRPTSGITAFGDLDATARRVLGTLGFALHGPYTALLAGDLDDAEQTAPAVLAARHLRDAGYRVVFGISVAPAHPTVTQQIVSAHTVAENIASWTEDIDGLQHSHELGTALTTVVGDHASVLQPLTDLVERSCIWLDGLEDPGVTPYAERLHELGQQIRSVETQIARIGEALLALDDLTPPDTDATWARAGHGTGPDLTHRAEADPRPLPPGTAATTARTR